MTEVVALWRCVTAALLPVPSAWAQSDGELHYESKSVDAGGVRLHYLEFDGDGLPLAFIHSESWDDRRSVRRPIG